jgi:hypothetical protein
MDKEVEKIINNYLKEVKNSLDYLKKAERKERLETIKAHIMNALEDQRGQKSDLEIVREAIKELGFPKTSKNKLRERIIGYISLAVIAVFLILMDVFLIYPVFGYSTSIPYILIAASGQGLLEIWNFFIKDKLPDKRYNIILAWIFFVVLIGELFLLEISISLPIIGSSFHVSWLVIMVYGIIAMIFTVLSIVIPGEIIDIKCPNCGKVIPGNSKFCLYCGEIIE